VLGAHTDFSQFAIGFDPRDRSRLHDLWDEVIDSGQWSDGEMTRRFEAAWSVWNETPSVAFAGWAGGALAALDYAGVAGETVLCPSNTFMATPLAIMAFESEQIARYCREHGIFLLEDCAHAHGADWGGRRPGTFGDAGVYSFYATKTVSTGEGGVLVSADEDLRAHARAFRDYGKPDYAVAGLNFRMSEFTAALGLVQTERMEAIVEWKNDAAREHLDPLHPHRLELPDGMVSGLYKYIVFSPIERSTGKVYDEPCHRIMGRHDDLPNTDWVADNHWCVPLYYHPLGDSAA
jgi:dTDP-4-amino-4,6-dideoxygalactose transaminase